MKHNFPPNKTICCIERHTYSQGEEFMFLAKEVGLNIESNTINDFHDRSYPYLVWFQNEISQCQNTDKLRDVDSYLTFKEFFKLLGPIHKVKIKELFSTI